MLVTGVLREEWGFKGAVLTDFASGQSQMDIKQMVYAGGDMWLDAITPGYYIKNICRIIDLSAKFGVSSYDFVTGQGNISFESP